MFGKKLFSEKNTILDNWYSVGSFAIILGHFEKNEKKILKKNFRKKFFLEKTVFGKKWPFAIIGIIMAHLGLFWGNLKIFLKKISEMFFYIIFFWKTFFQKKIPFWIVGIVLAHLGSSRVILESVSIKFTLSHRLVYPPTHVGVIK